MAEEGWGTEHAYVPGSVLTAVKAAEPQGGKGSLCSACPLLGVCSMQLGVLMGLCTWLRVVVDDPPAVHAITVCLMVVIPLDKLLTTYLLLDSHKAAASHRKAVARRRRLRVSTAPVSHCEHGWPPDRLAAWRQEAILPPAPPPPEA